MQINKECTWIICVCHWSKPFHWFLQTVSSQSFIKLYIKFCLFLGTKTTFCQRSFQFLTFTVLKYIQYFQTILYKNLPDEEIQQQIFSEFQVKPILMGLLAQYCQNQQISPQPERRQNLWINYFYTSQLQTNIILPQHYKFNEITGFPGRMLFHEVSFQNRL